MCIAEWGGSPFTRYIYQTGLGLGSRLDFWGCIGCLTFLALMMHVIAVLVLWAKVKKFQ
jgi:hypothetical protein